MPSELSTRALEALVREKNAKMNPTGLSERFKKTLEDRLAKKRKKVELDEDLFPSSKSAGAPSTSPRELNLSAFSEEDTSSSTDLKSIGRKAWDLADKGIDFLNEPLSGGYFGKLQRERAAAVPEVEGIKHTGGKNWLQDKASEASAMGRGFLRGAYEGAGDAADMLTTPSTWLSLAGAGAAKHLANVPKYAKAIPFINNAVRGIEATQIPHGLEAIAKADRSTTGGKLETLFGGIEALGGAVGTFAGDVPRVPKSVADEGIELKPSKAPAKAKAGAKGKDGQIIMKEGKKYKYNASTGKYTLLKEAGVKAEETPAQAPPAKVEVPKNPVLEAQKAELNKAATPNEDLIDPTLFPKEVVDDVHPTTVDDVDAPWDDAVAPVETTPKEGNIVDKLFPGLNQRPRKRNFIMDESGAVGSRAAAMKKTYDSLLAENAPDSAYSRVAAGAKPAKGQTYKQLAEEYIAAYEQMEANAAKPTPAGKPKKESPIAETSLPKKKVETEEEMIARLEQEVAANARKERAEAIAAGEEEIDPATLEAMKAEFARPEPGFGDEIPDPAPRDGMPLLRSKNIPLAELNFPPKGRLKTQKPMGVRLGQFLRDERGEIDLSALFQGEDDLGYNVRTNDPDAIDLGELNNLDEIDLNQAALEAGAETAKPVNPIMRFLGDESGEINLDAFRPDTRQFNEPIEPELFGKDSYSPRFEESGSAGYDQARLDELTDKGTNGTLTGDELVEARVLYKKLNPQNFRPEMSEAPPAPSMIDRFKNFMADESGELDVSALFDQADTPPTRSKFGELTDEDLHDLPIKPRVPRPEDEPSLARKIWDTPISTMATDAPFLTSAAFRQASPLAWTGNWFRSWGKAAKSYGSKEAYDGLMDEIRQMEYFKPRYRPIMKDGAITGYREMPSLAEQAGVKMTDFKHLSSREESIPRGLLENVPVLGSHIRASNRAYAGFLNSLRASKFTDMMNQLEFVEGNATNNVEKMKQIGEAINVLTGRASLKGKIPLTGKKFDVEDAANGLATMLWSPRLLMSKFKLLNVTNYPNLEPQVRKEYIKGLMRSTATWWGLAGLGSMAGASVSTDPNSADFGKIRIGNTRIDPGSGLQQLLVFGARMRPDALGGGFTSSTTGKESKFGEKGPYAKTRGGIAADFAMSKMHPMAKLAVDLFNVTNGKPVHLGDRAVQMALPMMTQDIIEVMKEDPELAATLAPLSSVGIGTGNYSGKDFNKPVFTDSIEQALELPPRSLAGTITKF